jgi:hypothetical protein
MFDEATVSTQIRMEAEDLEAYDEIAEEQGCSRNTAMVKVLKEALNARTTGKKGSSKPSEQAETPEELRRLLKWWAKLPGAEDAWVVIRDITKGYPSLERYTKWASDLKRFNLSDGQISGNQNLLRCMAMVEKSLDGAEITEEKLFKAAKKARAKF